MLRSVLREYGEFFLKKGLGLELAIAMVIGQQLTDITRSLSNDLLMPLLMPLLHAGNWHQWSIAYFGNTIEVGKITDMGLNTLITGFVLFLMLKAANRHQRLDG
ncbi:MAG: MscL family protein [Cyanobacteria bacterium REEB498]|nr:MscL family protein [Cyanobacteria bacterium REEB498]